MNYCFHNIKGLKKAFLALTCSALVATSAFADFARVEMGVGSWLQSPSGEMSYSNSGVTATDKSKENLNAQAYVWLLIKHPVPVIPNLRLEYVSVKNEGKASGSFKNFVAANAKTSLDITQFDVIPYYNILDNTFWATLDLGVDFKIIDGTYKAYDVTVSGVANSDYSKSQTLVIPMLYARTRAEIPATNIGLEADIKYIGYNASAIYDARVKIDYTLDFIPVIQPALELGYRIQKIKIDDNDFEDAKVDMDFAGVYFGVMLRF
jgi:outer membrane protein